MCMLKIGANAKNGNTCIEESSVCFFMELKKSLFRLICKLGVVEMLSTS